MSLEYYVTSAIPYVNAAPHVGHALELVQADALARHRRLRGQPVRFLTGTDDNALKNVAAAADTGVDPATFVAANGDRFAELADVLDLCVDDFIRTGSDPRHAPAVERLWRRSAARGDFYRRDYQGHYCEGCERFYESSELTAGRCPEHATALAAVTESNWFFRLSRYADEIREALETGRVRLEPSTRLNEVLAFVRSGLRDISVSRPAARAAGWGIAVPDDPGQVVYVWWDALANYISALGYGTDDPLYQRWWCGAGERVHVIGKGIVRFHAVYWLALLLSAGQPLPTAIFVHEYLTVNGAKIAKSAGTGIDPRDLVERYGVDALRWWLLREVARTGDTDFEPDRLVSRYHRDLANGVGNLVQRTLSIVHRYRSGLVDPDVWRTAVGPCADLAAAIKGVPERVDNALSVFDFRTALDSIGSVVDAANRLVETERPWELAKRGDADSARRLDLVLGTLVWTCRWLAAELGPFVPTGAARLAAQLGEGPAVGQPSAVFPRFH